MATTSITTEQEMLSRTKRLFSRAMKEECWQKSKRVGGRDGDRWRYDAGGRLVCRALTGCLGPLCHEYDHIIPFSKGGETASSNCQILQTRINREKKDTVIESNQALSTMGYEDLQLSHEELDLIEMAVYGDVRRSTEGPIPGYHSSTLKCECKTMKQLSDTFLGKICMTPADYSQKTFLPKI